MYRSRKKMNLLNSTWQAGHHLKTVNSIFKKCSPNIKVIKVNPKNKNC